MYILCSDTGEALVFLTNIMTALFEDTLLIGGDFNLPAIKWLGMSCSLPDHSSVNCVFLNVVNTFGLHQFLELPVRGQCAELVTKQLSRAVQGCLYCTRNK